MATEIMTVPYCHETFHEAMNIADAGYTFLEREGQKFVDNFLAPIVKKHNVEEAFGATLVHRHFDIEADEKLVEFNDITTPWFINVGANDFNGRSDSLIYETAWMLNPGGSWMAYEFSFSPVAGRDSYVVDIQDPKYQPFLAEYTAAVQAGGWEKLLGLRAWPGKGFQGVFEFSQGKANINLVPGQYDLSTTGIAYAETMWFWEESFVEMKGNCACGLGRHGGHIGHYKVKRSEPTSPGGLNGNVLVYPAGRE